MMLELTPLQISINKGIILEGIMRATDILLLYNCLSANFNTLFPGIDKKVTLSFLIYDMIVSFGIMYDVKLDTFRAFLHVLDTSCLVSHVPYLTPRFRIVK